MCFFLFFWHKKKLVLVRFLPNVTQKRGLGTARHTPSSEKIIRFVYFQLTELKVFERVNTCTLSFFFLVLKIRK